MSQPPSRFASLSTFASAFEILAVLLGIVSAFALFAMFAALMDADRPAAFVYGTTGMGGLVSAFSLYALAILFRCVLETYRHTETLLMCTQQ